MISGVGVWDFGRIVAEGKKETRVWRTGEEREGSR